MTPICSQGCRKTRDTNYSAISDHSKFRAKCPKVLQACDSGYTYKVRPNCSCLIGFYIGSDITTGWNIKTLLIPGAFFVLNLDKSFSDHDKLSQKGN